MLHQGYARAYRSNAVLTASPGQLVLMLYDGALKSIALARVAFERPASDFRRIEAINLHLTKAQAIIAELNAGLNFEAGGDIALNFNRLYDYYNRRLFEANIRKDPAPLLEVERLLGEVRNAWSEMLTQQGVTPSAEPVRGAA